MKDDDRHIHAEVWYTNSEGLPVHSDVCATKDTPEYRELLHQCLDEFLDNYCLDGGFGVGNFVDADMIEVDDR